MIEIRQTETYADWFASLQDRQARARIAICIRRLSLGNPGDVKAVGEGVSELRIDYGPGYRVYFVQRGQMVVILLAGGDKRTQDRDIKTALELVSRIVNFGTRKVPNFRVRLGAKRSNSWLLRAFATTHGAERRCFYVSKFMRRDTSPHRLGEHHGKHLKNPPLGSRRAP